MVCLFGGSQGRASGGALEELSRHLAGRWLCRFPEVVRSGRHYRGRLLGALETQVPRTVSSASFAGGARSVGADRAVVRDRTRDPRANACGAKRSAASAIFAAARIDACLAEGGDD